jgi:2-hydroxychromene-2-carboxylate isomerase
VSPKRPYKRVRLFGGGKLSRLVLDALRVSQQPLTASEIVSAVVAALGYGDEAFQAIADRVPATLSYMARTRGSVVREGEGRAAKWALHSTNG